MKMCEFFFFFFGDKKVIYSIYSIHTAYAYAITFELTCQQSRFYLALVLLNRIIHHYTRFV
jgi:hypothetical protein